MIDVMHTLWFVISWFVSGVIGLWLLIFWHNRDREGTFQLNFYQLILGIIIICYGYFTLLVAIIWWLDVYKLFEMPVVTYHIKGRKQK